MVAEPGPRWRARQMYERWYGVYGIYSVLGFDFELQPLVHKFGVCPPPLLLPHTSGGGVLKVSRVSVSFPHPQPQQHNICYT